MLVVINKLPLAVSSCDGPREPLQEEGDAPDHKTWSTAKGTANDKTGNRGSS